MCSWIHSCSHRYNSNLGIRLNYKYGWQIFCRECLRTENECNITSHTAHWPNYNPYNYSTGTKKDVGYNLLLHFYQKSGIALLFPKGSHLHQQLAMVKLQSQNELCSIAITTNTIATVAGERNLASLTNIIELHIANSLESNADQATG